MTLRATALAVVIATASVSLGVPADSQTKMWRIGLISGAARGIDGCTSAVRRGLNALGHIEGRTYEIVLRRSEGEVAPFPQLAAELVRSNVDVIVVTSLAIEAAKQATSTIPLIMSSSSYPVERGLIASLARPGGNITGQATHTGDLMQKRLQILKEAVPKVSRVAVFRLPGPVQDLFMRDIVAAGKQLGVQLLVSEVQKPAELPGAFQTATRGGAQALMTTQGPFFTVHRVQIGELALRHRLPSLSGEVGGAEAGALLFYGPDILAGCERVAGYVDRILKAARPADLPVEQPTKFELKINLKTARALNVPIPPSLLARAERVIE